jgi:hypothetical protein
MTRGNQLQLDELEQLIVDQSPFVVKAPVSLPWKNSDTRDVSEAGSNLESPFLVPGTNTIDNSTEGSFAFGADSTSTPFAQDSVLKSRQPIVSTSRMAGQPGFRQEHATVWPTESASEDRPAETLTLDPYLPIRFAMSAQHGRLSPQKISGILGPRAAALVLLEWLHLPATMQAASSNLLRPGEDRSVQVGNRRISVSSYLKMLAYLCQKIAERGDTSSVETAPGAPAKEIDVREEADVPHDAPKLPADVSAALSAKNWSSALSLAIQHGSRDVNELTDLIFFAQHPELPQARLDPKKPNYRKLAAEWSALLNGAVWTAIQQASANDAFAVSGAEVADKDRVFWGAAGQQLKLLVERAATQVNLNPGLLGVIVTSELERPYDLLSGAKIDSYYIGTDDFYEARTAIAARVPVYANVNWDKHQTPLTHDNDRMGTPRKVQTIFFDSGPDGLLAMAVYIKFREVRLREIASELKGDFDGLPVEYRFALTRMAMAAGTEGATSFLKDALAGKDILVRKPIAVAIYQTQRNATVRTAQAMHLSDWIFGIPLVARTQSQETFEHAQSWLVGPFEYEAPEDEHSLMFERETPPSSAPAYDREAAVKYAEDFAFHVCSDGFMMLADDVGVKYRGMPAVKMPADASIVNDSSSTEHVEKADGSPFTLSNGTAMTNKEMDDCTHFISCCIGRPPGGKGGGIRVPTTMWGDPKEDNPYGITRVPTMLAFLTTGKIVEKVADKTSDPAEISKLSKGDIIAYSHPTLGYTHLGLYLGNNKISSHTISRFGKNWKLGAPDNGFTWTLLHFV